MQPRQLIPKNYAIVQLNDIVSIAQNFSKRLQTIPNKCLLYFEQFSKECFSLMSYNLHCTRSNTNSKWIIFHDFIFYPTIALVV